MNEESKIKLWKIVWKSDSYAESGVEARTKEGARAKAENNEDENFKELDSLVDWEIVDIIEVE